MTLHRRDRKMLSEPRADRRPVAQTAHSTIERNAWSGLPAPGELAGSFGRYLAYLGSVRNLARNTVRAYCRDLVLWESFIKAANVSEDNSILVEELVRPFVSSLSRRGLSSRTVNRVLSAVRGYYRFKLRFEDESEPRQGIIQKNPFAAARGLRSEKKLPSFLFEEETEAVLGGRGETFPGLRDGAIFEFLYSTGCRVSEAVALDVTDLDLAGRSVTVQGKGGKERVVFIGRKAKAALESYLALRRHNLVSGRGEAGLFVSRRGKRLTDRGVRFLLQKHLQSINFRRKVTPHTFRHSFATHILNRGADIRIVQELLGHASLSTTQIYTHVDLNRLKAVHRAAHPHGKGGEVKEDG